MNEGMEKCWGASCDCTHDFAAEPQVLRPGLVSGRAQEGPHAHTESVFISSFLHALASTCFVPDCSRC